MTTNTRTRIFVWGLDDTGVRVWGLDVGKILTTNTKERVDIMALTKEEYIEYLNYIKKEKNTSTGIMAAYCAYAIPVGTFLEFEHKVLYNYEQSSDSEITFGILLADPEQSECREYLLNYLNIFHKKSGKLFDFYIPGFTDNKYHYEACEQNEGFSIDVSKNTPDISIDDNHYYFCRSYYEDFIVKMDETFNIQPTFNPMLILVEIKPGHAKGRKYVVIELDDLDSYGTRRSAAFFYELLNIIKKVGTLEEIVDKGKKYYVRTKCIGKIISAIGTSWLVEAKIVHDEWKRYKIKSL